MVNMIKDIESTINNHVESIIHTLSKKYNFDSSEAINFINKYSNINENTNSEQFNEKVGIFSVVDEISQISTNSRHEADDNVSVEPEKKKRGRPRKMNNDTNDQDKPKKKRGRPKKENKVTIVTDTEDEKEEKHQKTTDEIISSSITSSESISSNDELDEENLSDLDIDVENWTWKGDKYLRDNKGNVYCVNTHEIMGTYDQERDIIIIKN